MSEDSPLKSLFLACIDCSPEEQENILASSDLPAEVINQVRNMLKHEHLNFGLTSSLVQNISEELNYPPIQPGDSLNEYQMVSQIGQGGQGEVWLAKNKDQAFKHQVAIKIIKPVFNEHEMLRFQSERNIMASLKHPNIAQFIGGGTMEDGRIYMVLEWIEGLKITDYLRANKAGQTERLNIFKKVAEAVRFAHQNGIIHRDIKPSNVLVDDTGQVKLLDFGVAKQSHVDITETVNQQMLTMAYATPEQLTGQPTSTATDIYALGLLLYEIMAERPAHVQDIKSLAQMVEAVTRQVPKPPTQNKDLNNLIFKALKKDPNERYQTVAELIRDIDNYQQNKPLIATGDGVFYQLKKMLVRNPLPSLLTVLLMVSLITLLLFSWQHQSEMKTQVAVSERAKQDAEQQTLLAEKTKDFLLSILKSASPLGNQGKSISLDDVLATGEIQLLNGLNDQLLLKVSLLYTMADIHFNLGHYDRAIDFYRQGIGIADQHQLHAEMLQGLDQLAISLMWSGQTQQAESTIQQARNYFEAHAFDVAEQAWHLARLATWEQESMRAEQALSNIEQAFELLDQAQISDPQLYGRLYNEMAAAYRHQDDQKALEAINQAITYGQQAYHLIHPVIQERMTSKGVILMRLNKHQQAQEVLSQSLEMAKKLYQKDNPKLAGIYAEMATLYHDRGLFEQAQQAYQTALDNIEHSIGQHNSDYAIPLNNLAYLYEDLNQLQKAEQTFRESLSIRQQIMSNQPMRLASVKSNLARVLTKMRQFEEAKSLLAEAMIVYARNNRNNLYNEVTSTALMLSTDCDAGFESYQSLSRQLVEEDESSWRLMHSRVWLGQLLLSCGQAQEVEHLFKAAGQQAAHIYAPDSTGQKIIKQASTL